MFHCLDFIQPLFFVTSRREREREREGGGRREREREREGREREREREREWQRDGERYSPARLRNMKKEYNMNIVALVLYSYKR